ncbi:MAG: shikimate dehydrogenase [Flavobacteriales bacterium]|nr:shikimate dehydrogenase [Flavobacteriales bacterium]|tara:strand:+ start:93 stop:809 length:717 start_codon:yes stop_codon:yes gene_type:complete
MKTYALIGNNLSHTFSKNYFKKKFKKENISDQYINIELQHINEIKSIIKKYNLSGLNVTIPFKEKIIKYLDAISTEAEKIQAVNTIKIINKKLIGFNTDYQGFYSSIQPILNKRKGAIILGSGGSSKAVQFSMRKLGINHIVIGRNTELTYDDIDKEILEKYEIIVNCTPLGSYPKLYEYPNLPYKYLNTKHLLFDLIYNPSITEFIKLGKRQKCCVKNGLEMLEIQANLSWDIWNSK